MSYILTTWVVYKKRMTGEEDRGNGEGSEGKPGRSNLKTGAADERLVRRLVSVGLAPVPIVAALLPQ